MAMNVKVKIYDESKYNPTSEKIAEAEYHNIKGFEIKNLTNEQAAEIGFEHFDEYNEYLIITLSNDETASFRNSNVDMFRI